MALFSRFLGFSHRFWLLAGLVLLLLLGVLLIFNQTSAPSHTPLSEIKPALVVQLTSPQEEDWQENLAATGSIFAWQEALISPEIANYRITEVRVDVGDQVKKGDVLAKISPETIAAELAEAQAGVAELKAAAKETQSNAQRAEELRKKGFYSEQMNVQYQTAAHTAAARLLAAEARSNAVQTRMSKTVIMAPDSGLISFKEAAVGSLTQSGQVLFKIIREARLEWRAEISSALVGAILVGQTASIYLPSGEVLEGRVRAVSPAINPQTRNALVYVDLPKESAARSGMFATGDFLLTTRSVFTLPQSAVLLREGFSYVFVPEISGAEVGEQIDAKTRSGTATKTYTARLTQTKVMLGQRKGDRVEILSGLPPTASVVEKGVGFLADRDFVKVVHD